MRGNQAHRRAVSGSNDITAAAAENGAAHDAWPSTAREAGRIDLSAADDATVICAKNSNEFLKRATLKKSDANAVFRRAKRTAPNTGLRGRFITSGHISHMECFL